MVVAEDKYIEAIEIIEEIDFWNLSSYQEDRVANLDGFNWIYEVVDRSRYKVTDRHSPRRISAYGRLGVYLIKLSGMKDIEIY